MRKIIQTEPCPNCGVLIHKIDGCNKVICGKCKYDFCWECLGSFKNYRHDKDGDFYCVLRQIALGFIVGGLISIAAIKAIENYNRTHKPLESKDSYPTILERLDAGESIFTMENLIIITLEFIGIHIYIGFFACIVLMTNECLN